MTTNTSLDNFLNSFSSYNPYDICDQKNISVLFENIGAVYGYYYLERKYQFIVINNDLDDYTQQLVCAHELGHALFHPEMNAFYTIFPHGKFERQANEFAINLLLMKARQDYPYYDLYQLARVAGIPRHLLESAFDNIIVA